VDVWPRNDTGGAQPELAPGESAASGLQVQLLLRGDASGLQVQLTPDRDVNRLQVELALGGGCGRQHPHCE
jgi:hypothetical protein